MFVSTAYAQASGGASGGDPLLGFLPIILMFVVLYFLMIRPQMKRSKEHKTMLEMIKKGDEVVTSGGIVGKVIKVGESYVTIEISQSGEESVQMHLQKAAVQTLLPSGTMKAI